MLWFSLSVYSSHLLLQAINQLKTESIWPTTIGGLLGMVAAFVSVGVIAFDRITGRASNWRDVKNDLKDLCNRMESEETATKNVGVKVDDMDDLLTGINYEIRGVTGENGMRQAMKDIKIAIELIQVRNRKMDIKAAVFEKMLKHTNYDGPERREVIRRVQDLLEDDEEDKG